MGRDDIVVGNNPSASVRVAASLTSQADDTVSASRHTLVRPAAGAMRQQRGNAGTQSQPQEFVQLVGCRDPDANKASKPGRR